MRLRQLFEQTEKHVSFCFGRMNPPTIGHAEVFKTLESVGGDYYIFVSQSQDRKDNPLGYSEKINFIKSIHPKYADHVIENTELNTVVKVASYLYEQGYKHATFVAGSDRLPQFQKLLLQYNGVEGKAHGYYNFELLDFKSSGDRDPDSPGVSGISASKAREAAANNDFEKFKEATGAGEQAKAMFDAVRKGLGINESKIYQRHQELRKKSGLPHPDYYQELKKTFDMPPDERKAKTAELKQKYKVKEGIKSKLAGAALAAANIMNPVQAEPIKPITIAYVMIDGEVRKYNLGDKFQSAREAEEFITNVLDKRGLSGYTIDIKHGYPKNKDPGNKESYT